MSECRKRAAETCKGAEMQREKSEVSHRPYTPHLSSFTSLRLSSLYRYGSARQGNDSPLFVPRAEGTEVRRE